MKKNIIKNKKAFTLSEVMITLLILGVTIAMVAPVIMNNANEQAFISGYKNILMTLTDATDQIATSNSGTLYGLWVDSCGAGGTSSGLHSEQMLSSYSEQLDVVKTCTTSDQSGCWANNYRYMNGTPLGNPYQSDFSAKLSSGAVVNFFVEEGTCGSNKWNKIFIDINGKKGPNVVGKDYHTLILSLPSKIVPESYDASESDINDNCPDSKNSGDGTTCGAKILLGKY